MRDCVRHEFHGTDSGDAVTTDQAVTPVLDNERLPERELRTK